jgi:hypothetical protein
LDSQNLKKYKQWLEKTKTTLNDSTKESLGLPDIFKWLRYWANKLKVDEPDDFKLIEKEYKKVAFEVAKRLYSENKNYLIEAQKHGKMTNARLVKILRFVYHYGRYTHDCFIEGEQQGEAKMTLQNFWAIYGEEIIENKQTLSNFEIESILRLLRQSKKIGVTINSEWEEEFEDMVRSIDPFLIDQAKNQLEVAEANLKREETLAGLIIADQALELLLSELCTRYGCEDETKNKKGNPFQQWGFSDYVNYLSQHKEIDSIEKGTLFRFHQWRNSAHHSGLEPSARLVHNVIEEIRRFIEEHYD